MKRIALVLCAAWALGAMAVTGVTGQVAPAAATGSVVGTAPSVDETTLAIGDRAATSPAAAAAGPNTLSYFLRMVVVLALVLAVVYVAYRLMRALARPKAAEESAVKLLASTSLGQGRAIHVIGLGAKAYLVGATDSSISLISEVDDKELLDALALKSATAQSSTKAGNFGELLGSLLGTRRRGGGAKGERRVQEAGGDFLARQRERLRKF